MINARVWILGAAVASVAFVGTYSLSAAERPRLGAATTSQPGEERHPAIHKALRNLREAKAALQHADRDFAGHRAAALKDTEAAIAECELALQSDPK